MNTEEIKKYVTELILLSLDNQEIENPKVDCKFIWYDLKTDKGKSEFFKDISAIANTVGLDGFIIIGFDDKSKQFKDVTFKDCGLRDTSDLYSLVAKNVEGPIDFALYPVEAEGHYLNVIYIPPSLSKPHIIKRHKTFEKDGSLKREEEHRIFVRKSTGIFVANKYDLDFMYYDRKNIIPDHDVFVSYNKLTLNISAPNPRDYSTPPTLSTYIVNVEMNFENTGKRPIAINTIFFDLFNSEDQSDEESINFISDHIDPYNNKIIKANDISVLMVNLSTLPTDRVSPEVAYAKSIEYNNKKHHLKIKNVRIFTENGYKINGRMK